jgi:transposase
MPRGKQFDIGEKAKVMAWFYVGISAKEIASRLQRDVSGIRKVINQNKALPLTATPLPPKKRSGRPSVMTNRKVERLGRYLKRFPFKTARQLKAEVQGWSDVSVRTIQKVRQKRLKMLGRQKAAVNSKDGQKEAAVLPEVQGVDG